MINYRWFAKAIRYYRLCGYKPVELPWVASSEAIEATLPPCGLPINSDVGILVGSAEQSFLDKVAQDGLIGRYQATTPCFRNEVVDKIHKKYFMKTELFNNEDTDPAELEKMIGQALKFFNSIDPEVKFVVEQTGILMYDIVEERTKIEVGSYGVRYYDKYGPWMYGTGLAEPRLGTAITESYKRGFPQ